MSAPVLTIENFAGWLASGERGLSAEAIVEKLTGHPVGRSHRDHPWDAGDFRRCEMLLRDVPIARLVFSEMREVSRTWAALVDAWDELVALLESEVPDAFTHQFHGGSAPLTSARISAILGGAR